MEINAVKINAMDSHSCKNKKGSLTADAKLELEKFCGECKWAPMITYNARVQYLKLKYSLGDDETKPDSLKKPIICKEQ